MKTIVNSGHWDDEHFPEWNGPRHGHVKLGTAGEYAGVALPDWVQPGALISPERARELGLQLLDQADLYDTIAENAVQRLAPQRAEGE